jgi:hypothetical protein
MIHIGDQFKLVKSGGVFMVVSMTASEAGLQDLSNTEYTARVSLNPLTQDLVYSDEWVEVSCVHRPKVPRPSTDHVEREVYHVRAAAAMEYRLIDVYRMIERAIETLGQGNTGNIEWGLEWAKSGIERTAERVATMDTPAGVHNWNSFRDALYANRK